MATAEAIGLPLSLQLDPGLTIRPINTFDFNADQTPDLQREHDRAVHASLAQKD
jgi:hypothetical protein